MVATKIFGRGRSLALLAALALAVVAATLAGLSRTGQAAAPSSGATLAYEAESLLENKPATAPLRAQGNCCGIAWSGDAQLFFLATEPGDTFTVAFDVPAGGSYDVSAYLTKARDYGSYTLAVDGKRLGGVFDGYSPTVTRTGPVPLGGVGLRKGRHEITLTVTGKNPAASNFYAGLDLFVFERSAKG
ncbi:hypothetical protein GBA65_20305 [Rubrobacter marinus]|uniref:CBM6 domain-containing protein n=1 Tax=Rubrobacter marinus TaxID=2653852 RepID=A0A6G8Q1X0_9ACTN|nr:hypothetical protein [Rubrobacter marinus]QIN80471.1 hypothetical protein GBA65_20305 [Rubrobacter marinus]